jgi:hypothetical protein
MHLALARGKGVACAYEYAVAHRVLVRIVEDTGRALGRRLDSLLLIEEDQTQPFPSCLGYAVEAVCADLGMMLSKIPEHDVASVQGRFDIIVVPANHIDSAELRAMLRGFAGTCRRLVVMCDNPDNRYFTVRRHCGGVGEADIRDTAPLRWGYLDGPPWPYGLTVIAGRKFGPLALRLMRIAARGLVQGWLPFEMSLPNAVRKHFAHATFVVYQPATSAPVAVSAAATADG